MLPKLLFPVFLLLAVSNYCAAQHTSKTIRIGGTASVGNIHDSSATVAQVLTQPFIRISNGDCTILSYDAALVSDKNKQVIGPWVIKGAAFSKQLLDAIQKKMAPGSGTLFIDNIQLKCGDSSATVMPFRLHIKHD